MKWTNSKIWTIVKNKYVIATLVFVVYICFMTENNLRVVCRVKSEVKELQRQEDELKTKITSDSLVVLSLSTDLSAIEKFGRENYYMKAPGEDVFVVREK